MIVGKKAVVGLIMESHPKSNGSVNISQCTGPVVPMAAVQHGSVTQTTIT